MTKQSEKKVIRNYLRTKKANLNKDKLLKLFDKADVKIPTKEEAKKILKENFYDLDDALKLLSKDIIKKSNFDINSFEIPKKLIKHIILLSAVFALLEQSVPTRTQEIEDKIEDIVLVDMELLGSVDKGKLFNLGKDFKNSDVLPILTSRKLKSNPSELGYSGRNIPNTLTSANIRFGLNKKGDIIFNFDELKKHNGPVYVYKSK